MSYNLETLVNNFIPFLTSPFGILFFALIYVFWVEKGRWMDSQAPGLLIFSKTSWGRLAAALASSRGCPGLSRRRLWVVFGPSPLVAPLPSPGPRGGGNRYFKRFGAPALRNGDSRRLALVSWPWLLAPGCWL